MTTEPTPRSGQSPFLPGTCIQYAFDSTSLGWFKKCPRFYQLSMIEGWRPKRGSFHLTFGIHYTNALEHYDKIKADPGLEFDHDVAVALVVDKIMNDTWIAGDEQTEGSRWDSGDANKNTYTLLRSIVWYLDQFKDDPAQTVIAEDGTPLVERSFRMELEWGPEDNEFLPRHGAPRYLLSGHLDRVVNFLGGTYVMDHKTTKTTVSDYYFDQYEPNNQMTLYTIAAKVIFNTPVKGVIIDAAQSAVGFTRFARGMTYRTDAQLSEWLHDLRFWFSQAESCATEGYWPMNDVACFNCPFNQHDTKICAKDPAVRPAFLEANFTQEQPWNPLLQRN